MTSKNNFKKFTKYFFLIIKKHKQIRLNTVKASYFIIILIPSRNKGLYHAHNDTTKESPPGISSAPVLLQSGLT
jgi:hypothetical protein